MMVIPDEVTGFGFAHVALDVMMHVIISPSDNVELVNIVLLVPALAAPIFH